MPSQLSTFALWSYAASALLHSVFAIYLFAAWRGRLSGALLCAAVAFGAASAAANWAFLLGGQSWFLQLAAVLGAMWFAGWAAFVGVLLQTVLGRSGWILFLAGASIALLQLLAVTARSEERRVGKECRSRWSPY